MTSTPTQILRRLVRTGLIVLALGGATMAAAPAQAAGSSNAQFSFSLNFGNGQFTITNHRRHPRHHCAPLPHVRQAFQNHGYYDIHFGHQRGPWVIVHAQKGRWAYTFRVNRCTWEVILVERHRVHPRWNQPHWPNNPHWHDNPGWHGGHHWNGYNN